MINFTIESVTRILNGKLFKGVDYTNLPVKKIVTDSRNFFEGNNTVFIALKGPRNNGHRYISNLAAKAIAAFIVSESKVITDKATFILVEDTTVALQQLAAFNRAQMKYPVIGITGSNGKTIIKEWLFNLLTNQYRIVRNPKSYNSQVGVPLSVLLMDSSHNLGIFEAGISQPGEMQNLAAIIQPEIGIFTNIGDAHQEGFISTKQKIEEKLKLFEKSKKLVYSEDSPFIAETAGKFCTVKGIQPVNWSYKNKQAAILFSVKKEMEFTLVTASFNNTNVQFQIPFTDDSSLENACHCFAAVIALNAAIGSVLPGFTTLFPIEMRLEIKQGINNCLLVNDFYNSDLNSLAMALSVLHQQAAKAHLYKLVIISDIQQTGLPDSELYQQVNNLLTTWKIDEIIGIGTGISGCSDLFSMKKSFFDSTADFIARINRSRFQSAAILIKGARQFTFEKTQLMLQFKAHLTRLEIDLNALTNNLNVYRKLLNPGTKIMVMVKAFSYGSGDIEIASALQYQQVDYLAVAVTDEGVLLRNAGISTPVIVMNPEQQSFQHIIDFQLEPNIYSIALLEKFLETARQNGLRNFPVHLKIDTGMNRLGFKSSEEIKQVLQILEESEHLKIKSVFSHLAASDDAGFDDFTQSQFSKFDEILNLISTKVNYPFDRHILNSAGIERFPEKQYEMVRLGIGLYGISVTGLPLQNIGKLLSTVSQVKKVALGETVGYSRKGVINRESSVAIVPMGYADGLDRKLGNRNGCAFVGGKKVPIIGNICMDMLMLDVNETNVKEGDTVEFFGPDISISEVAEKAGTIPYEILTGISQRVKRVYLQE
ncbi:MAG TPA: bifunctional UDP-N-acetylmuramoyl-tripeptide:D-alanyl-D-alanine ligase/alanine racemase [Prolixibacteraceae bacterium]|nr:bifunctional UDP-N-acetylmuramoyl-tripeptide:D-alanyl-D-alanine ligase/alanine racemase [Prolixibacteraceae bacterium]